MPPGFTPALGPGELGPNVPPGFFEYQRAFPPVIELPETTINIGMVEEFNVSLTVLTAKSKALNQVEEFNAGITITGNKSLTIAQVSTINIAMAIVAQRLKLIGQASQTEIAQILLVRPLKIPVGLVIEVDNSQIMRTLKSRGLGTNAFDNPVLASGTTHWANNNTGGSTITFAGRAIMPDNPNQFGWRTAGTNGNDGTLRRFGASSTPINLIPASPNEPWTLETTFYAVDGTANRGSRVELTFYDSGSVAIGSASISSELLLTNGVRTKRTLTAISPAGTAFVRPTMNVLSNTALDTIDVYMTEVTLVQSNAPLGVAFESQIAMSLSRLKSRPVTQVTGVNTAFTITAKKLRSILAVSETDSATNITAPKIRNIARVIETNLSQAFAHIKKRALGLTTEVDTGQALLHKKLRNLGLVSETDTPFVLSPAGRVARVIETDLAQTLAARRSKSFLGVTETGLSQPLSRRKSRLLGAALETDLALLLAHNKKRTIIQATESDLGIALTRRKSRVLALVTEIELAQHFTRPVFQLVTRVVEIDLALALGHKKVRLFGRSSEVDVSNALIATRVRSFALSQVGEADLAGVMRREIPFFGFPITGHSPAAGIGHVLDPQVSGHDIETDSGQTTVIKTGRTSTIQTGRPS